MGILQQCPRAAAREGQHEFMHQRADSSGKAFISAWEHAGERAGHDVAAGGGGGVLTGVPGGAATHSIYCIMQNGRMNGNSSGGAVHRASLSLLDIAQMYKLKTSARASSSLPAAGPAPLGGRLAC